MVTLQWFAGTLPQTQRQKSLQDEPKLIIEGQEKNCHLNEISVQYSKFFSKCSTFVMLKNTFSKTTSNPQVIIFSWLTLERGKNIARTVSHSHNQTSGLFPCWVRKGGWWVVQRMEREGSLSGVVNCWGVLPKSNFFHTHYVSPWALIHWGHSWSMM